MNDAFSLLIEKIGELLQGGASAIVAIDGLCGSGKSTLAELIAREQHASVFHTDDFYLPMDSRLPGWEHIPAGNMDIPRLKTQVLIPASEGRRLIYQPYSCQLGALDEAAVVEPERLCIVEGSYCLHPELRDLYDLTVFLTCSDAQQLRRLRLRENGDTELFEKRWIPMERLYHRAFSLPDRRDIVIDTTNMF